jgi:4'-phosphopantetheinyl transferase
VHASIARTAGRTAVAVGSLGPLGIDVERVDAHRFAGVADVALHPEEHGATTLPELATHWVRKEAVLKATGWGLPWDPSRVDVSSRAASPFPVTVSRDGRPVRLWVSDVPVDAEYAAAVAVVSRNPPRVLVLG